MIAPDVSPRYIATFSKVGDSVTLFANITERPAILSFFDVMFKSADLKYSLGDLAGLADDFTKISPLINAAK